MLSPWRALTFHAVTYTCHDNTAYLLLSLAGMIFLHVGRAMCWQMLQRLISSLTNACTVLRRHAIVLSCHWQHNVHCVRCRMAPELFPSVPGTMSGVNTRKEAEDRVTEKVSSMQAGQQGHCELVQQCFQKHYSWLCAGSGVYTGLCVSDGPCRWMCFPLVWCCGRSGRWGSSPTPTSACRRSLRAS